MTAEFEPSLGGPVNGSMGRDKYPFTDQATINAGAKVPRNHRGAGRPVAGSV